MCGICGVWNTDGHPVDPALLVRMRDSLAHRGPDGAGCVFFDVRHPDAPPLVLRDRAGDAARPAEGPGRHSLGLGHRRLSIIDLDTGDQPMANEDGSVWAVF